MKSLANTIGWIIGIPVLIVVTTAIVLVVLITTFGDFYEYLWKKIKERWIKFGWWIVRDVKWK